MKVYVILLLSVISVHGAAIAQGRLIDSLYSTILRQERPLQIVFPQGGPPQTENDYELLLCLDGISSTLQMEVGLLQSEGFIPKKIILVGVPAISVRGISTREYDYTPTRTASNTGGAAKFLEFLKQELIPYLKQKLPLKSSGHSLYGASMAGLFSVYAFLNEPTLFTSYLAIDPSLWWDHFYMKKAMEKRFSSTHQLQNTLWIAGREGIPYQTMGIATIDSILRKGVPKGLPWKCAAYADETHYSTMFKGFWDGMKFSYGGFYAAEGAYPASRGILMKPLAGIVLKDKAFPLACYNLGAAQNIRFTIDGTVPTLNAKPLSGQETWIQLSQASKVILKSLSIRQEYDRYATGFFQIGKTIPPLKTLTGCIVVFVLPTLRAIGIPFRTWKNLKPIRWVLRTKILS